MKNASSRQEKKKTHHTPYQNRTLQKALCYLLPPVTSEERYLQENYRQQPNPDKGAKSSPTLLKTWLGSGELLLVQKIKQNRTRKLKPAQPFLKPKIKIIYILCFHILHNHNIFNVKYYHLPCRWKFLPPAAILFF